MHFRWFFVFSGSLILVACSTLSVTPEGADVRLFREFSQAELKDYEKVADVRCDRAGRRIHQGSAFINCSIDLRNRAAALGADLVVLTEDNRNVTDCAGCVTLAGTAYRAKLASNLKSLPTHSDIAP